MLSLAEVFLQPQIAHFTIARARPTSDDPQQSAANVLIPRATWKIPLVSESIPRWKE